MSFEQSPRVYQLFEGALQLPETGRSPFLQAACEEDPEIFAAVLSLLEITRNLSGLYRITRVCGHGAMGVVCEAVDEKLDRKVALKFVSFEAGSAEVDLLEEQLLREARAASKLRHPGIVDIHNVDQVEDITFIVMELIEGQTLAELLKARSEESKPMVRSQALEFLRQAADALDYAHENGVVHRDIKPSNIIVQSGGIVKLTDFGIAKIASTGPRTFTVSGGTPGYMPLEQMSGNATAKSDQFALAVVAHEMLVIGARTRLPGAVRKVLQRGAATFPEDRYATCGHFVNALMRACRRIVTIRWSAIAAAIICALVVARFTHIFPPAERTGPSRTAQENKTPTTSAPGPAPVTKRGPNNSGTVESRLRVSPAPLVSADRTTRVNVPANQAWTASGVFVRGGDLVTVSASGEVSFSAGDAAVSPPGGTSQDCLTAFRGPNGWRAHPYVANQLPCLSLLGRIGENGDVFYIGAASTFRATTSGQLYFGVNDNVFGDNSGQWVAAVEVQGGSAPGRSITVRVAANRAWTDSGVDLHQGDTVNSVASGLVTVSRDGHFPAMPPAGFPPDCTKASAVYGPFFVPFPAPQLPCWSLIGRIATTGSIFEIGSEKTFQTQSEGELYLGVNDNNVGDNAGFWTATIKVQPDARLPGQPLTILAMKPEAVLQGQKRKYKLIGTGLSADTSVYVDAPAFVGSNPNEPADSLPSEVAPDGTWMTIYIAIGSQPARATVRLTLRNPGGKDVFLNVPIQR